MKLFDETTYIPQLVEDTKIFYQQFLDSTHEQLIETDSKNIQEFLYNKVYKRINQYEIDNINSVSFEADFFQQIKNHNNLLSKQWYPESSPDNLGRLVVNKKAGYDRKLLIPGTYLKQDLLSNFINSNQKIDVSIPDRWNIEENNQAEIDTQEQEKKDVYGHFYGETLSDDLTENRNKMRFYFNFNPVADNIINDLQLFLNALFSKLNRRKIPFHLKCKKNLSEFWADGMVLYIERRYLIILLDILEELYPLIEQSMRANAPMFTYLFKNGIGISEGINPMYSDESFGQRVTDLMVQFCEKLKSKNVQSNNITFDIVKSNLKDSGRNNFLLFLNDTSRFEYEYFPLNRSKTSLYRTHEDVELEKIIMFGYEVCRDAIWDNKGRCTWISVPQSNENVDKYEPLSISYLNGLSGILLYLIEIYSITHKPLFKRNGMGLIKTILEKLIDKPFHWGFHDGTISVIYVLLRAIKLFDFGDEYEIKYKNKIYSLITSTNPMKDSPLDISGGMAGTLWGLLLLKKMDENSTLLDEKIASIKDLIVKIEKWKTDSYIFKKESSLSGVDSQAISQMTGLAHGISGIAYVLSVYLQQFPLDNDRDVITERIEESLRIEAELRRFEHQKTPNQKPVWLDIYTPDGENKQPQWHWQRAVGGVSYSRIGLERTLKNHQYRDDIVAEFEFLTQHTKRDIMSALEIPATGMIDFLIECCYLSLITKEKIWDYVDRVISDNESKLPIMSLDGNAGLGLSMLRLYAMKMGFIIDSYILPT